MHAGRSVRSPEPEPLANLLSDLPGVEVRGAQGKTFFARRCRLAPRSTCLCLLALCVVGSFSLALWPVYQLDCPPVSFVLTGVMCFCASAAAKTAPAQQQQQQPPKDPFMSLFDTIPQQQQPMMQVGVACVLTLCAVWLPCSFGAMSRFKHVMRWLACQQLATRRILCLGFFSTAVAAAAAPKPLL
jgi:hypothetical protein